LKRIRQNAIVVCAVLLLLLAVFAVGRFGGWRGFLQPRAVPEVAISVSTASVDPLNEGRLVSVQGRLESAKAPTDAQLGVVGDHAVALIRRVEMYQWREACVDTSCVQSAAWSETLIDASAFHVQEGHENPPAFPFESTRFDAEGIHLGAFRPDLELILAQVKPVARALRLEELPANLAASASEIDGRIYIGNDPLNPAVGDLRIGYAIIPSATTILTGIQRSGRLVAAGPKNPL
jgi:hypothetical protein